MSNKTSTCRNFLIDTNQPIITKHLPNKASIKGVMSGCRHVDMSTMPTINYRDYKNKECIINYYILSTSTVSTVLSTFLYLLYLAKGAVSSNISSYRLVSTYRHAIHIRKWKIENSNQSTSQHIDFSTVSSIIVGTKRCDMGE